jgi:predicted O-linked N-acetylglucosamine transferase (SPINDLY family)
MNDRLLRDADSEYRHGNLEQAAKLYAEVLRTEPRNLDALCLLGAIKARQGALEDARALAHRAALCVNGRLHDLFKLGCLEQDLGRMAQALASFEGAIAMAPDFADAWEKRGDVLLRLKRAEEAFASYGRALSGKPNHGPLWFNRGIAAIEIGMPDEALRCFDRVLAIEPKWNEALYCRANALIRLGRQEEALTWLERFLALSPGHVDALVARGVAEAALGRLEAAASSCDCALAVDPDCLNALFNRGDILALLGRYEDAAAALEKVLALDPSRRHARGNLIHCRLMSCDWREFEESKDLFAAAAKPGMPPIQPFIATLLSRKPAEQLICAQTWAAAECPKAPQSFWQGERYGHDRIRVAYLSSDFKFHATAVLMAGVFEHHDKARFETFALSYGEDDRSETRERLRSGFDHFIDVRDRSEAEIASLIREKEIDIAVDLKGYTEGSRNRILGFRPAPLQVQFVGYPGTLGTSYIDYLLADRTVIPEADRAHYSEHIVYLPDTYQPNDSRRIRPERIPDRAQAGLPQEGFVFCSFNNVFKFTPEVFAVWMRLLGAIEGSVLWLLDDNPAASRSLREKAERACISSSRLVFAPRADYASHLARQCLADLFLDTLPYNAHTTASDALWMGLPLLTCMGETFAGRVAASLLNAIGLPELITRTLGDYEALALRLARDPAELAQVKAKLKANRDTAPLFDTARFTRHLEKAFAAMHERQRSGLPPQAFAVDELRARFS